MRRQIRQHAKVTPALLQKHPNARPCVTYVEKLRKYCAVNSSVRRSETAKRKKEERVAGGRQSDRRADKPKVDRATGSTLDVIFHA